MTDKKLTVHEIMARIKLMKEEIEKITSMPKPAGDFAIGGAVALKQLSEWIEREWPEDFGG